MRCVWFLLVACACSDPPAQREEAPPVRSPPPKIGQRQVDVIVDGERYTTLSTAELVVGVELAQRIPEHPLATWAVLTMYGPTVGPTEMLHPSPPLVRLEPGAALASVILRDSELREDGIDEIRIVLAEHERTPAEALAQGCVTPKRGAEAPEPPPEHWSGEAYQFNTDTHRSLDVRLALSGAVGTRIGTLTSRIRRGDQTSTCTSALYRAADQQGRRVVISRVRSGDCIDGTFIVFCEGTSLGVRGYYMDGTYVLYGAIVPVR
jgi:hypothetical protein